MSQLTRGRIKGPLWMTSKMMNVVVGLNTKPQQQNKHQTKSQLIRSATCIIQGCFASPGRRDKNETIVVQ